MKKYIFLVAFAMFTFSFFGQSQSDTNTVQIGTIFKIGKPVAMNYRHVKFPKPNMIAKQGGVADYKSVVGNVVVVTSIHQKKDGTTMVKVKRKNGKRFFGSHAFISIYLKNALLSEELIPLEI